VEQVGHHDAAAGAAGKMRSVAVAGERSTGMVGSQPETAVTLITKSPPWL
jgi:hypothetical protein